MPKVSNVPNMPNTPEPNTIHGDTTRLPALLWRHYVLLAALCGFFCTGTLLGAGTRSVFMPHSTAECFASWLTWNGTLTVLAAFLCCFLLWVAANAGRADGMDRAGEAGVTSKADANGGAGTHTALSAKTRGIVLLLACLAGAVWSTFLHSGLPLPQALPSDAHAKSWIEGRVCAVQSSAGRRLRVVLDAVYHAPSQHETKQNSHVLKATATTEPNAAPSAATPPNTAAWRPLPARVIVTWQNPLFRPIIGEQLRLIGRLKPQHGFINPTQWNSAEQSARQGIGYRVWAQGNKGHVTRIAPSPFSPSKQTNEIMLAKSFPQTLAHSLVKPLAASLSASREWVQTRLLQALSVAQEQSMHLPFSMLFIAPQNATFSPSSPAFPRLSPALAAIPALLLGERFYLPEQTMTQLADAGLIHSFALSGLHLGLVAGFGLALAWALGQLFPRIYLRVPRPKLAVILAAPLVLCYLWLGGATPPLLRSFLMFAFWGILLLRGHKGVLLDGLLGALLLIFACTPLAVHELSLQLSLVAVAGIAAIMPHWNGLLRHWKNRVYAAHPALDRAAHTVYPFQFNHAPYSPYSAHTNRSAYSTHISHTTPPASYSTLAALWGYRLIWGSASILVVSLAAQTALLPLTLHAFGTVTPAFWLNLLWLPVLGIWVLPISFAGLFFALLPLTHSTIAPALLALAALPANWLFHFVDALNAAHIVFPVLSLRPLGSAMLGFFVLFATLVVPCTAKNRRAAVLFLCCGFALLVSAPLLEWQETHTQRVSLQLIDVGQGQAVLVEAPHGERMLIDAGGFGISAADTGRLMVSPATAHNRPPQLSYIVNTHPDSDHLGGVPFMLEHYTARAFLHNGDLFAVAPANATRRDEYAPHSTVAAPATAQYVPHHVSQPAPQYAAKARAVTRALALSGTPQEIPRAGQSYSLGNGVRVDVLWPLANALPRKKSNANSLVLRLMWHNRPLALMPADLERAELRKMLDHYNALPCSQAAPHPLHADLLLLPHHGAKSSFYAPLYDVVAPHYAFAATGYGNYWKFPNAVVCQALAKRGIALYDTGTCGQIRATWSNTPPTTADTLVGNTAAPAPKISFSYWNNRFEY